MAAVRTETREEIDREMAAPPVRSRSPFYALTFRNYRLFFYGQTVSVAGTWMQMVAQQWLVWQLTKSEAWLGYVSFAGAVPFLFFATWGGGLADRFNRRDILLVTQAFAMAIAFGLAFLASGWVVTPLAWHVAVFAALSGVVNAFNMPAQQALVTDMVEDRSALANAIALNSLRFNMARVLGPMVAGWVLVRYSAAACFFLNAFSFVAVFASLLAMRISFAGGDSKRRDPWGGFAYVWQRRATLRTILLMGSAALFAWSASTLFPALAADFGVGADGFSRMMTFNGLGAAVGGLFLAALGERFRRRALIYGGIFAFAGALLLLSYATAYWPALGCLALSGFAMILFGISSQTKVQEEVPDDLRGRVMGVFTLVFNGLLPFGGLLAGVLAERYGAARAVRLNASACLVFALLVFAWSLLDRTRRPAPAAN